MNDKIKEIIAKTATETDTDKVKVTKVVENLFCFLRNSMSELKAKKFYIPKFGHFDIIKKRYEKLHPIKEDTDEIEIVTPKKRNLKAKNYTKTNNDNIETN